MPINRQVVRVDFKKTGPTICCLKNARFKNNDSDKL